VPNIAAEDGWYSGLAARYHASRGLNPRGFRLSSDVRAEAASPIDPADTSRSRVFGRGSLEVTVTKGLSRAFDAALTVSGGSSLGDVPVQRLYYLGGTQTIRGQDPSPFLAGNAFWLGRAELARPIAFLKLSAFGDFGWAGDRDHIGDIVRPASGAGLGFSFLDGTARFDIARGIYPAKQTRLAFYLGSRF
jgi:outer membrane protein assembly factor BamA